MDFRLENDYHPSLEPEVVINDHCDEEFEEDEKNGWYETESSHIGKNESQNIVGPDISIIPIKKKPKIKIRLFEKEYSPSKDDIKVQSRGSRSQVRLVSKDEAESAEETYTKRKSQPLEKCNICKKFFRRMKTHLLKHENSMKNPNDSLSCSICNKTFNSHNYLQSHLKSHRGEKPYVCEVCQKSFAQSCNLVNHMRIHTGERPFKCPHCDRAFTQSGNLNNHIRLHTDEKPFKCHFCEKAFVQSGNLNSHIRNNHKFDADLTEFNNIKFEKE